MRKLILAAFALIVAMSISTGMASAKPEKQHRHPFTGASVHQGMYMQLLAEKYAPETSGEWKQLFQERRRLFEEMRNLDENSRSGVREEMRRLLHDRDGKMKGHMETVVEFTKAVESADEKKIQEVLPKMLAAEKQFNKAIAETLKGITKK